MAEETGIVLPWEKDAMAGLEMPDGLYPTQTKSYIFPCGCCTASIIRKSLTEKWQQRKRRSCLRNTSATSIRTKWGSNGLRLSG